MAERVTQIILNTTNYISGSTNNNASYYIDWGAILKPNVPYKLHWTYMGGLNTYNGTKAAFVSINFNFNVYQASGTAIGASTSNIVGFLKPVVITPASNTVFLMADTATNEPVYMERRPLNNNFNVQIVDVNGALWLDNAATPVVPANWSLTLHFTEAERADKSV
jgi:hypothetical protein